MGYVTKTFGIGKRMRYYARYKGTRYDNGTKFVRNSRKYNLICNVNEPVRRCRYTLKKIP